MTFVHWFLYELVHKQRLLYLHLPHGGSITFQHDLPQPAARTRGRTVQNVTTRTPHEDAITLLRNAHRERLTTYGPQAAQQVINMIVWNE